MKSNLSIFIIASAACFLSCNSAAENQPFTFSSSKKIISLNGLWKFSTGDDLRWSKPDYDDTKWESVPVPDIWISRELSGSGTCWYRTLIVVSSADSSEETSIWIRGMMNAGEVFWDGNLVGGRGSIGQGGSPEISGKGRYSTIHLGRTMTRGRHLLALRIANSQLYSGGIAEPPDLGYSTILMLRDQRSRAIFGFLVGVFILSGIHLLILFAGDRTRRENLYFGLLSFISAAFVLLVETPDLIGFEREYPVVGNVASLILVSLPLLMYLFLAQRFQFDARWLKRLMVIASVCVGVQSLIPLEYLLRHPGFITVRDLWVQFAFLIGLYVVAWAVWKRKPGSTTLVLGVLAVALGAIAAFARRESMWGFSGAALSILMVTISLSREMSHIQHEVRSMLDVFRLFVPEPVLDRIAKLGLQSIRLGGAEEGIATILFIDIKSFTSVAEKLSPNQTLDFLNAFMRRMQPLINARGGFINQFVGDEIMAIFHHPGHAVAAVDTALALQRELESYNEQRKTLSEMPIEMGIGMNTGGIIWGTIGSEVRMESAVIGDPVNLASRLQSLTRQYGALILGSEHLLRQIPDMSKYAYREVDIVQVKGKTEAVAVYEFFDGDPEPVRSQKCMAVEPFMQGIVRYRANEWVPAEALFATCIEVCPGDSVARMYIERCRRMRASPPGAAWDGVTVQKRK
jgi:class 3 adenylate cyclase